MRPLVVFVNNVGRTFVHTPEGVQVSCQSCKHLGKTHTDAMVGSKIGKCLQFGNTVTESSACTAFEER